MVRTRIAALAAPVLLLAAGCGSQTSKKPAEGETPPTAQKPAATTGQTTGEVSPASHAAPTSDVSPVVGSSSQTSSSSASSGKKLSADEHVAQAVELSAQGKRREAIAAYTAALKQNPKHLTALLYRGGENYALQNFDAAEQDLAQALAVDPNYAEAYILRAHLWGVKHEYQKAVDDFYTALKHPEREANFADYFGDRKDVVAHIYLAAAYAECPDLSFRDDEKAYQHALKACQLDGWKNRRYVFLLVNAIAGAKTEEEALRRQQEAIAAAPESVHQQLEGAVEAFDRRSEFQVR